MRIDCNVDHKKVHLIERFEELESCCSEILKFPEIALDTEFDRNRNRFGFHVCVIQVATPEDIFIIDPLAISKEEDYQVSLRPLFQILENPAITKVIHACSEDLRLFAKMGCMVENVFDTRIAAMVLCLKSDSFKILLQEFLEIEIDKSLQKSNWYNRPFTREDFQYLANDVAYLISMKNALESQLKEKNRRSWFEEEMEIETDFDPNQDFDYSITVVKSKGRFQQLTDYKKAFFEKIWDFRGDFARKLDIPPFYAFSDDSIFQFVEMEELDSNTQLTGIHRKLKHQDEDNLVAFLLETRRKLDESGLSKEVVRMKRHAPFNHAHPLHTRKESQEKVAALFKLVSEYLRSQYDEVTEQFLLSNADLRKIAENGNMTHMPMYAIEEVMVAARETGVDIREYLI